MRSLDESWAGSISQERSSAAPLLFSFFCYRPHSACVLACVLTRHFAELELALMPSLMPTGDLETLESPLHMMVPID